MLKYVIFTIILFYKEIFTQSCENGVNQSPIDLSKDFSKYIYDNNTRIETTFYNILNRPELIIDNNKIKINNNQTDFGSIVFTKPGSGTITYKAIEITFLIPNEHTINNKTASLEMQIIHETNSYSDSTNRNLVISIIFVERSIHNSPIIKAIKNFNEKPFSSSSNSTLETKDTFDLNNIIKPSKAYFHYEGTIDNSSCQQNTNWLIQNYFYPISESQMLVFNNFVDENNLKLVPRQTNLLQDTNIKILFNNNFSIDILYTDSQFVHLKYFVILIISLIYL